MKKQAERLRSRAKAEFHITAAATDRPGSAAAPPPLTDEDEDDW
jgi:hypothetical protein